MHVPDVESRNLLERRRRPRVRLPEPVPLLVCGDKPLYRAAIACLIQRDPAFRVVRESANSASRIRRTLSETAARIVILDFDLNSGTDCNVLDNILDTIAPRPAILVSTEVDAT